MKAFDFNRYIVGICVVLISGGCSSGSAQLPSRAISQSVSISQKSSPLLYVAVSVGSRDEVNVYTFPHGSLKQTLTGFQGITGICSGPGGNIFIDNQTSSTSGFIAEYAHGGTAPIATLEDPSGAPGDCSVDHRTREILPWLMSIVVSQYTVALRVPQSITQPKALSLTPTILPTMRVAIFMLLAPIRLAGFPPGAPRDSPFIFIRTPAANMAL